MTLKWLVYIFCASPIVYVLVYSFSSQWVFPRLIPDFTLGQWAGLLSSREALLESLLMSVLISLSMSILSTLLAFFTSSFLYHSPYFFRYQRFAYLPFAISPVIYGVILHYFFNYTNLSATVWGVMLAQLFILYPYSFILFSGFWNKKIFDYRDLVATLGGNHWVQWRKGIWPTARNMVLLSLVQTFLISWFDFGLTQYIGIGKVKTLTIQVYQLINEANPYYAAVASVLLLLPPLILMMLNRFFVLNRALLTGESH